MGVPSFYRWLVNKYPNVVVKAIEEKGDCIDSTSTNPNGMEFDNLYLDMNGIIHPCFHPDDHVTPPTTFEEVFNSIFEYIDRLFSIVRPRKLLYMAVDGVAPRAKMNQQRSRRFRTSKDNEIAEAEEERLRSVFEMEGKQVLPKQESEVSDPNIITPGTVFMYKLSKALQGYIRLRIKNDAGWKDVKVILSDANVPGEGEHKIMSFIRLQRNLPDYNPNTRHCLYGLDADLIMLALATHEVHFSILREDVLVQEQQPSCASRLETSLSKAESSLVKSRGWFKQVQTGYENVYLIRKPYQFLNIWTLREYLELDMKIADPPENDIERIIDDFIFICFLTGNDFLPHMPTLEIHEGAIDLLMTVYKKEFKNLGGFLVDTERVEDKKMGFIKLKRVEKFILLVGTYEEKIFKKRSELRERILKRFQRDYSDGQDEKGDQGGDLELNTRNTHDAFPIRRAPNSLDPAAVTVENLPSSSGTENLTADKSEILRNTKELKEKLKGYIREKSDMFKNGGLGTDKVRLANIGWKKRYYKEKFSAERPEDIEIMRKAIVHKYTEGLLWVLLYYFSGVPSWTWFYPYHYGPFASDLKGLTHVKVKFQKGSPFKPFDQLMGVLPPMSAQALPEVYRSLMTDEQSNIIDLYPTDFEVDTYGKRYQWQGISKLPFIEEERLLSETGKLEKELEGEEALRNAQHVDQLFVRSSNNLGSQILSLYQKQVSREQNEIKEMIDTSLSGGINGYMRPSQEDLIVSSSTCPEKGWNNIQEDNVLCVLYELPSGHPHIPRLLEGTDPPVKTISEADIEETQLWHESQGGRPAPRLQSQGRYTKANNGDECTLPNSKSEVMHKGAGGMGWGLGRGKGCPSTTDCRGNGHRVAQSGSSSARGELMGASSKWVAAGKSHGHPVMSSFNQNLNSVTSHGRAALNEKWKIVGSNEGGMPHGIENLKISESSQGFSSYGRGQIRNNNFCSYGNGLPYNANYAWRPNYAWRQRVQSDSATPSGHGRGRCQAGSTVDYTWQHNQLSPTGPSMQAGGRGHFVSSTGDTKWNTWQHNQLSPTDPSMQAGGRGHFVSSTGDTKWNTWQHNQLSPTGPSMQAGGRGHFVSSTGDTKWNSRDATGTPVMDWRSRRS